MLGHCRTVVVNPRRASELPRATKYRCPTQNYLAYWFWGGTLESVLGKKFPHVSFKNLCRVRCQRSLGSWAGVPSIKGKMGGPAVASILFIWRWLVFVALHSSSLSAWAWPPGGDPQAHQPRWVSSYLLDSAGPCAKLWQVRYRHPLTRLLSWPPSPSYLGQNLMTAITSSRSDPHGPGPGTSRGPRSHGWKDAFQWMSGRVSPNTLWDAISWVRLPQSCPYPSVWVRMILHGRIV